MVIKLADPWFKVVFRNMIYEMQRCFRLRYQQLVTKAPIRGKYLGQEPSS